MVMGCVDRKPTAEELTRMQALLMYAIYAGAFGMSTGLIYLPSAYSGTDEVVTLARVVSTEASIFLSHIKNEYGEIFDAVDESTNIVREAGLPVHISHFKVADNTIGGDSTLSLGMVEAAREVGLADTIDQYLYTAGSAGLANVLPKWARAGSKEDFQARHDNPEIRARKKADAVDKLNGARAAGDLSRITAASFDSNPAYDGNRMAEATSCVALSPP